MTVSVLFSLSSNLDDECDVDNCEPRTEGQSPSLGQFSFQSRNDCRKDCTQPGKSSVEREELETVQRHE